MTTNAANQHRTGLHFIAKQNERINKYDEINESAAWQTMYCHFLTKSKVNFVCSTSKHEKNALDFQRMEIVLHSPHKQRQQQKTAHIN